MLEVRKAELSYRLSGDSAAQPSALAATSLTLCPGEILALTGSNGAGKSTLARVVCGSLEPDNGQLVLDGTEVLPAELRLVAGFVRQDPESQLVAPDVFDEVAFGPCNLGLHEGEVRTRVAEALGACGLAGFENRLVSELSGGELQRLAMAGVMAMHPRYLVLDEVTSQLDTSSRLEVRSVVRSRAREGVGVLMVTHDAEELAAAHRVALMEHGRVVWEGTPNALFSSEGLLRRAGLASSRSARVFSMLSSRGFRLGSPVEPCDVEAFARANDMDDTLTAVLAPSCPSTSEDAACSTLSRDGTKGRKAQEGNLVLAGVSVYFGERRALDDANFTCAAGKVTLVAGPSGSGKSTLACVAAGILEPDAGTACLDTKPVIPGQVGLCLQRCEDQLFCESVYDDVAFAPRNLGVSQKECDERCTAALRNLGIDERLWARSPFALSGGQRRRVALAGIVAFGPHVYVLDEPTIGLDATGRLLLHDLARQLAKTGCVVLVVSHDLDEWLDVADDVALILQGRVSWSGSAACLIADSSPLEAAGIIPPLWLRLRRCRVASAGAGASQTGRDVELASHGGQIRLPHTDKPASAQHNSVRRTSLFGSYHAAATPIHRLDARVKLVLLLLAAIAVFAARQPAVLVVMAALMVVFSRLGGVSMRSLFGALRPAALILAFSLAANALVFDGTGDIALVGIVGVSLAGLARGTLVVVRIAVLVGASLVVSSTTSSTAIADAFAALMSPLGRLGVPTADVAMIVSVALRFLPLTATELVRLRDAQRARGVDFSKGGVVTRVRRWLCVLTPLVVAMFRRADDLAAAMRERCYRGEGRTRLSRPMRCVDVAVLVGGLLACVLACLV